MGPNLKQKNIEMEIIIKETDLQLELDLNLIEQVLINLLVNAMEAVKESEHPRISLSAATMSNNKIAIKISDNGVGISPELIDKIFVPFFTTRKNGSGIGLSLCKQIMLLHHGNIKVSSVVGKGSEFVMTFPLQG
jgi:signal transduction histidine kinase